MQGKKLFPWRMVWVAGGTICLLGLLVLWRFTAMPPEDDGYQTLYRNLPLAEAGNIKDILNEEYQIPVKLEIPVKPAQEGTSVRVPKERLEETLIRMAQWRGRGLFGPDSALFGEVYTVRGAQSSDIYSAHTTEDSARSEGNPFLQTNKNPLSTFSIDVDTAAYSTIRYSIEAGVLPPQDVVRIEEMINYFTYAYPEPSGKHPFSLSADVAECPWKPENKLLRIGLRVKSSKFDKLPPQNLVFLIDVFGLSFVENKLPLVQHSLKLLVEQLRPQDHVAIAVYSGAAGLVLPPTSGAQKKEILAAIDQLDAGGSTADGEGIELAYATAKKYFRAKGNNQVILATNSNFNLGPSSDDELNRLIEEKRKQGLYLSVFSYGGGDHSDGILKRLAEKGNGHHGYIDTLSEAHKILVTQSSRTMLTLAKDVKLQLAFNPRKVSSYRLIGYENRLLKNKDFEADTQDTDELIAGTTVTALYELGYQQSNMRPEAHDSQELLSLQLRYKLPDSETSQLLNQAITDQTQAWSAVSEDFRFAAAVASFGMQLRISEHKGSWKIADVMTQARQNLGEDKEGYRQGFVDLVEKMQVPLASVASNRQAN